MEVPRVPPIGPADSGPPASGDRPAGGGGDLPFGPGQKLFAQVMQVLGDGRAILDVGGERLIASTPLPVRNGEVLAVVVRGVGAVIELDIEAPPVAFSERAYALAAVRQAIQQAGPSAPLTAAEVEVLAHALERANWGGGAAGASPRDRLLGMLRPLPLTRDAAPLVDALRDRLASGGAFFEAHAARALTRGAHPAVTPDLQGDLRWLLAALEREAVVQPGIEPLRQRLIQDIASRQLDVALANVKDGAVRVDVPVAFGHNDTTARLTVKDDGPASSARRAAARPRHHADRRASRTRPDRGVRAVAARAARRAISRSASRCGTANRRRALDAAAGDLGVRLRAAGFRHVGIAVVVDPEAAIRTPRDDGPDEPPPGGIHPVRAGLVHHGLLTMSEPRLRVAALRYDHPKDRAPKLVARGEGHVAERILALAREHGIPVHEDRELVDVLARLDLEEDIPGEVYQVVAEILAFLYRAHLAARPPTSRAL